MAKYTKDTEDSPEQRKKEKSKDQDLEPQRETTQNKRGKEEDPDDNE
ncbi:hypothetical protein [Alteribacter natronophilus]|nr:hypothetical protein [Alteribacter natronophilus]